MGGGALPCACWDGAAEADVEGPGDRCVGAALCEGPLGAVVAAGSSASPRVMPMVKTAIPTAAAMAAPAERRRVRTGRLWRPLIRGRPAGGGGGSASGWRSPARLHPTGDAPAQDGPVLAFWGPDHGGMAASRRLRRSVQGRGG